MNVEKASEIQTELVEAAKAIFEKHGLKFGGSKGKFEDNEIEIKIKGYLPGVQNKLKLDALKLEYPYIDFDAVARIHGARYKIVDYRKRSILEPWVLYNLDTGNQSTITHRGAFLYFKKSPT